MAAERIEVRYGEDMYAELALLHPGDRLLVVAPVFHRHACERAMHEAGRQYNFVGTHADESALSTCLSGVGTVLVVDQRSLQRRLVLRRLEVLRFAGAVVEVRRPE